MRLAAAAMAVAFAAAGQAFADRPTVATDIPPVHSLVARVMQGVGEPVLIVPPGASPHGHAMRPSEAAALADADVVVWMGEGLTPWLQRAVEALSGDAVSLELLEVEGTMLLGFREGASFGEHAHDGERGEDEQLHGAADPHAWLDPENAKLWLGAIAAALAEADPANAEAYAKNAEQGRAEIEALTSELDETLAPVRGRPFIVFHDAYHYFEHRFGIEATGAISLGDASAPSPARIAELRDAVRRLGARCIFAEPQFPQDLIETVTEGTEARAAVLDPLGVGVETGPELYPAMMRGLARALRDCLEGAG